MNGNRPRPIPNTQEESIRTSPHPSTTDQHEKSKHHKQDSGYN